MVFQGKGQVIRQDIQVLRGLAVTIVVAYHAKLDWLQSGFLGVDIFFVISGYLITSQIAKSIAAGHFNIVDFYYRRAKRLLPAAYVTIFFVWLAAKFLLSPAELKSLAAQILGALTFSGNIVLWRQSGYFDQSAELKVLLHTWSLAVEEQYYFLIPGVLLLVPQKRWLSILVVLFGSSLALCLLFQHKEAAFYLMPFRAWEMMVGSISALLAGRLSKGFALGPVLVSCWLAVVALPILPAWGGHPGLMALTVCIATALIILSNAQDVHVNFISNVMSKVGDFSYSLYLVHWPVFAFANNVWQPEGGLPWAWRWGLIGISFALGYALYVLVERPFHTALRITRTKMLAGVAACSGFLLLIGIVGINALPDKNLVTVARNPNPGFDLSCDNTSDHFEPKPLCQSGTHPSVLVWGDSFAMHLVGGLLDTKQMDLIQATKAVCGPLLGLAVVRAQSFRGEAWARQCISFNDSVLDWLRRAPWVKKVILASPFDQYVNPDERDLVRSDDDGLERVRPANIDHAYDRLAHTVLAIRKLGKEVIIFAPPPFANFDLGRCVERASLGRLIAGVPEDCRISVDDYHAHRANVINLMLRAERGLPAKVVRFDQVLCDDRFCNVWINGVPVYKDKGHFSQGGVREVFKYIDEL